jgi:SAM-dependent methyltransferase
VVELRRRFDEDAERYDRARPRYPAGVFDDLAAFGGLGAGARVLEIGCGTGQATVALAQRGWRVTAVELGANMARVARRNLTAYPDVEVVTAAFEQWPLPAEPYDAVFAATAYHWLDPTVRVSRSADALRPGGVLATIGTDHIEGGTVDFFADAQGCYERFDPDTPPGLRLQPAAAIARDDAELVGSGRFGPVSFIDHEWDVPYTTGTYLDVLLTYSGHRALPEPARSRLLDCLAALIDGRHGGRIVKRYLARLRLARRTA